MDASRLSYCIERSSARAIDLQISKTPLKQSSYVMSKHDHKYIYLDLI